jgi:outer membrane protein insertion porin family
VIRRELAVNPGEVFDLVRVRLSTNRLFGLNYFAKVEAEPEPTDVPDRKNLVVGVEEKNTGDVRVGAGFSSLDELSGFVEVAQGNFDPSRRISERASEIRLRVMVGTQRRDLELSFVEPWFLGRKLILNTDFFYRQLRYYSDLYNVDQLGSRITLTRTLWNDFWRGTVGYAIENVGIVDMPDPLLVLGPDGQPTYVDAVPPEIRSEEGYTLASKVIGAISYDTRNSVILPNRGQHTTFRTEFAGGPFGGDTDFYKLELDSRHYFRGFAPGHVLELIGRIGVVDNHGFDQNVHLYDRLPRQHCVGYIPGDGRMINRTVSGRTFGWSAEYSIPIIVVWSGCVL